MIQEGNLNVPWNLHGYNYTDCVGDNNTWKIIIGYIIRLKAVVIA